MKIKMSGIAYVSSTINILNECCRHLQTTPIKPATVVHNTSLRLLLWQIKKNSHLIYGKILQILRIKSAHQ